MGSLGLGRAAPGLARLAQAGPGWARLAQAGPGWARAWGLVLYIGGFPFNLLYYILFPGANDISSSFVRFADFHVFQIKK